MNNGTWSGLKPLPDIPAWMGGMNPSNDGFELVADSTQEGGARLQQRRTAVGGVPTIAAANGTSSLSVAGHDEAHNVQVSVPGGNTVDAAICTLTFNSTYGLYLPTFGITPKTGPSAAAQPFIMTDTATGYQIGLHNPPAAVALGTPTFRTSSITTTGFAVGTGSLQTMTVTIPSAVVVGDLMILICYTRSGGFGIQATPSGWTNQIPTFTNGGTAHSANTEISVYTKLAVVGDTGGSTTVTLQSNYLSSVVFMAYSNAALAPNVWGSSQANTGTALTSPSQTPNTSNTVALEFWGAYIGSGTTEAINTWAATNRGSAVTFSNGTFTDSISLAISEQAGPASGSPSGTNSATSNTSGEWVAVTYLLAPYVTPPTAMGFDVLVTAR